ncbi:MAG TPA: serine/threonine-protein kinase [Polyangiaceae bacterium]
MSYATELADTEPLSARVRSQAEPHSGVRLGSVPADSEQDVRFLQDRMAMFNRVTFWISGMFLLATTMADLASEAKRYTALGRGSHAFGTLIALGLWLLLRNRRSFAPRALQVIDAAGTLGICWSFAAMGYHAAQPYGFYTSLLAITHVSVARAMIVPSVPQLTLLLGAAGFASLVVSRATIPLPPELVPIVGTRPRSLVEAALWSTAGAVVCTLASKVIYGLQEKAREARQLGQYVLEEKIGAGGMGEVYRARHAMLRRPTAVKLLAGEGSEHQLRRFEKEVQLTAKLAHPNTISIFDFGRTPDGVFYYAMELLEGLTLEQLVQCFGAQPPGRVIRILTQVCGALAEAHGVDLIHRDIKPANIHLSRHGGLPDFVKVLDFGLVRELKNDNDVTHSNINTVVGTPLYLSPEAILAPSRLDARADLYGLGCVAYFLLTGKPPFSGGSVVELCSHHLHTPPRPPSELLPVPADLERVVLACLAKDPAGRPQSARELARELRACRDAHSWSDADAEVWWQKNEALPRERPAPAAESGEQTRRTICCADLEKRVAACEGAG